MIINQRGFALVLVLWVLTLLALMAGSFAKTMRRDSSVSLALKNNAQISALSESVLSWTAAKILASTPEQPWLVDGTIYQILRQDGSQIRIKAVSEAGKIDINVAPQPLLKAVISTVTTDLWAEQKLLNSILDWRDADDDPRPHGAEQKQYQEAGLNYQPSNAAFQSLDELRLVLGMEPDIFAKISPYLTVYSGQANVNLQNASPEVQQIVSSALPGSASLPTQGAPGNTGLGQNSSASSGANQIYTISVEVLIDNQTAHSIEAVVQLAHENANQAAQQVLEWRPNQLTQSLFAYGMDSRLISIQDEFTILN